MDDMEEMRRVQSVIAPDDIERKAFYAAALGILRAIRLIVIVCLLLEIFGRVIQVLYIALPSFGAH